MPGPSDPYAAFRLNLEQQRKRAKDLLRAVRAGDAAAHRRLADAVALPVPDAAMIKLADAQFAIARELGFRTWRDLRAHVMAQTAAREALTQAGPAVDADMPTLHVRCGSDIEGELEAARFSGDFLAVWDPFPVGPVTDAPDWIAQRARFHAETGTARDVDYDAFLAELTDADRRLAASAVTINGHTAGEPCGPRQCGTVVSSRTTEGSRPRHKSRRDPEIDAFTISRPG
jgi:hypothetical protein